MIADTQYEDLLAYVYTDGHTKSDRTGTGTLSTFGAQLRYDLRDGFPLITTKKVYTKAVISELLWFLRGDTNIKWLHEHGCTIWDEWADTEGNLGPVYGKQWRSWPTEDGGSVDQIAEAIRLLRTDPDSRRIIVSAWNVGQLKDMALMPCHAFFQFYTVEAAGTRYLSCQVYQRSADLFLGVPFNIASYSLLLQMMAQQCGMVARDLIWVGGDCHIYSNHFAAVKEQLLREVYPFCTLALNPAADIDSYSHSDFEFVNYVHHAAIKAPVAV